MADGFCPPWNLGSKLNLNFFIKCQNLHLTFGKSGRLDWVGRWAIWISGCSFLLWEELGWELSSEVVLGKAIRRDFSFCIFIILDRFCKILRRNFLLLDGNLLWVSNSWTQAIFMWKESPWWSIDWLTLPEICIPSENFRKIKSFLMKMWPF